MMEFGKNLLASARYD